MEALTPVCKSNFDLIVVGAGPAGSSAAITAARSGASVLLCERGRFPRQRVCGEFVSSESLDLLSNLLADQAAPLIDAAPRISAARFFAEGRTISTVVDPPATSISRFDIDLALWNVAAHLGVRALDQTTVERIEGTAHFALLRATESSLRMRWSMPLDDGRIWLAPAPSHMTGQACAGWASRRTLQNRIPHLRLIFIFSKAVIAESNPSVLLPRPRNPIASMRARWCEPM
jgi:hypothetical protein